MSKGESIHLKDFWKWSSSDLVSNATRGILAEYLVASALGLDQGIRNEWDAYDLKTSKGVKIEVKSAAYVQSWYQRRLSTISFDIKPTLAWDYETNLQAKEKKRHADIYVFCLLHHKDKDTINPMDMSQWTFYIVSKDKMEQIYSKAKSIGLSKLKKLNPEVCDFNGLRETFVKVSKLV
ncbi:MAG: hypothetical protein ACYS6K_17525 [Planctomycetota bacterium]